VAQLLDRFAVPAEQAKLVLRNGVYLAPEERATTRLADGDEIAVWPPVAGG
ncbi:MAG TPA: molybdopterin synthase sulfur carrier subunit, partial [Rhodocyclaceae bacterium]|nr:molybdopterin synthase sulfur carrier subunit [Rhodocyclaceae bacterium]